MVELVTLSPRHQTLAAVAVVMCISGVAIAHAGTLPEAPPPAVIDLPPDTQVVAAPPPIDTRAVTCMAKVVQHEAGNQPREGRIAVAHVLMNRVKAGFADHVCAVANQRGQFFPLSSYHPDRNSAGWADAVAIARDVLAGEVRDHSNGALFFHANWARTDSFFRTRTKVARLDDHDFYR
jgi:N-acetylmuramoyl-L-alanine amidase